MNNLKSLLDSVNEKFNAYEQLKNTKTTSAYKKSLLTLQRETQLLRKPLTASKKSISHGLVEPPKVKQEPLMVPVELPVNTAETLNPVLRDTPVQTKNKRVRKEKK